MRSRASVLLLAGLLLAGCDRTRAVPPAAPPDAAHGGSRVEPQYVPPTLTPAESAAAVQKNRANEEAATRRVRGRLPDGAMPVPTPPVVVTPETSYQTCLVQARSAEEPLRSTIMRVCDKQRPD
ncbi:MAG TPA: hypothetical protein VF665_24040 [Longimicrobium sp.]|jgi:hypothetical protein|uniref:hypothetical protein n=1 Tax=Longimicrobium sp. TaxID=2029185 RepID=UPI002ED8913C